jgi:hypothetical protein
MRSVLSALLLAGVMATAPRVATASGLPGDVVAYDSVDSFEIENANRLIITGLRAGEKQASTATYFIRYSGGSGPQVDYAAQCQRMALLAMSKPGKYTFSIVQEDDEFVHCRLAARKP